jgi:hypothetical protein
VREVHFCRCSVDCKERSHCWGRTKVGVVLVRPRVQGGCHFRSQLVVPSFILCCRQRRWIASDHELRIKQYEYSTMEDDGIAVGERREVGIGLAREESGVARLGTFELVRADSTTHFICSIQHDLPSSLSERASDGSRGLHQTRVDARVLPPATREQWAARRRRVVTISPIDARHVFGCG